MSNSSLASYVAFNNKNVSNRGTNQILYVIPHCYVGQVTAKQGVDAFNKRNGASVHYIVGKDGSIGQQVDEKYRAWTTGGDKTLVNSYGSFTGRAMDFQGVTIECACDSFAPYAITEEAYAALVNLMADIAKRNLGGELKWKNNPKLVGRPEEQNVLVHRWFASKECPGDYIMEHLADICEKANAVIKTGVPYVPQEIVMTAAKPTLKQGSKGAQVKLLQQNLQHLGYSVGSCGADGDFGNATKLAVIAFQNGYGLTKDGIYGPKSYAAMIAALK